MFVLFCSAAGLTASCTQNISKRAVSSVSGSQEEDSGEPCITGSLPSSLASKQQWVAQEHSSCPFVEPSKGCSTQVPASSHHMPGCHKPQAGFLCSSRTRRNQVSVTLHTQTPPLDVTGQAITSPGPGPCIPPRCPSAGTLVVPLLPVARSL